MSNFPHILHAYCSETGAVRGNNEDAFLALPEAGAYAVADGMGGGSAGEVASAMLVERLSEVLSQSAEDTPGLRKYNAQQAIHAANESIIAYAQEHHFAQMGTTLVLFIADPWQPEQALLCHLGDSRAYRLRQGALACLTTDHNLGASMAPSGGLFGHRPTPEECHAARLLTRAVGISSQAVPEWQELKLQPGDRYLLCTDGVYSMLEEKTLRELLRQGDTPEAAVALLREAVLAAGAKDNFTMLCLDIAEALPMAAAPSPEEAQESAYLMKIAEWRKDNNA